LRIVAETSAEIDVCIPVGGGSKLGEEVGELVLPAIVEMPGRFRNVSHARQVEGGGVDCNYLTWLAVF